MPLSLAEYAAYWFVKQRLGAATKDTEPPDDGLLHVGNRKRLAGQIAGDVDAAGLYSGTHRVNLDLNRFGAAADSWGTIYDAVGSALACAREIELHKFNPKAAAHAFADYMATRWIYRRVLGEDIKTRPEDDEAFPPPYDADARRGLARRLASNCSHIGIELRDTESFVAGASRWRHLSDPRGSLLRQLLLTLAIAIFAVPVEAQLADAGGTSDEAISIFLQKAKGDDWRGGVATRGEQTLAAGQMRVNWQLDYGSSEVSRNSGVYTLGYVWSHSERWRLKAEAGLEHRRTLSSDLIRDNHANAIVSASLRTIGAKTLWRGNLQPQGSWLLQANLGTSTALIPEGDTRELFFDPVAVGWIAFLPGFITVPNQPRVLFRRIQLRAELAAMRAFDAAIDAKGHWDGSITFFFTPANGVVLRRFDGFFDHNLRDRTAATTFSLLWKFR